MPAWMLATLLPILGFVAVLLLEAIARVWFRWGERYYVFMPGLRCEFEVPRPFRPAVKSPAVFSINSWGERGDEPPRRRDGLYRVLIAGGSAAACGFLAQQAAFPAILQRILRTPEALIVLGAKQVHVGNVGRSFVDSGALALVLQRILPRYRSLDLLIIMCGQSDALRWLSAGAPDGQPAPPVGETEVLAVSPGRKYGWTPRGCALWALYRRLLVRFVRPLYRLSPGGGIVEDMAARAAVAEFTPLTQDYSAVLRNCERNFRQALEVAKRYARRVLVAEVTGWPKQRFTAEEEARFWNGRIGSGPGPGGALFVSTQDLFRLISEVNRAVQGVASEMNVEFLPLSPLLAPLPEPCYDHFHFTEEGARVVGEALAAAALRPPGIPASR